MHKRSTVRLGFLGFGEAAQRYAADFRQRGLTGMVAYSRAGAVASARDPLRRRAAATGVSLVATPRALAQQADVIMGLTPGANAISALRSLRPHLDASHIYADCSAASVKAMQRAAQLLEGRAGFVDAAIMGAVTLGGIATPVVTSGPAAQRFCRVVRPWGMNVSVVGTQPGAASAMKLIRSVCFKGLACLLHESLESAQRLGILQAVACDLAATFDDGPFRNLMKRLVCGTAVHAGRRVHEMTDALALLDGLGSSTRMTRATTAQLKAVSAMGLRDRFGGREPGDMAVVMQAIVAAVDRQRRRVPPA